MIIYCDMDMVLCNFLKGALDVTGELFQTRLENFRKMKRKLSFIKERFLGHIRMDA